MSRLKSLEPKYPIPRDTRTLAAGQNILGNGEEGLYRRCRFLHCKLIAAYAAHALIWPDGRRAKCLPDPCGMVDHGFSDDVLLPEYELLGYAADSPLTPWPVDIRKAYVSRDDKPHVFKPLTPHRLAPKELLRAELMIILGVMLRRMKVPSLERHRAIPP
ncbi:hypothetical protein ASPCAL13211 [Aspergillus calidoustus]|uniref:Uncharacterized protein n=1 Tax=Aspergillus calidoustus TaxID=454130 RepID=A0A0U5H7M6_ASPCI|nr:hypothetical protein ASPCAL13211 [Aspergillus calidoustus]